MTVTPLGGPTSGLEEELRRRVAHMRAEREHVDFLRKTADLIERRLGRGIPAEQRDSMAASLEALVRANRALREGAGGTPDPGELAAEEALLALPCGPKFGR